MADTSSDWAVIGTGGSWTTAVAWTPPTVPGATSDVLIGTSASNTAAAWTVTVAGAQAAANLTMDMGNNGTLSVAGALDVSGSANLGYGTVAGGVLAVNDGASLSVLGNMGAVLATIDVVGGTVTTGGYADLDYSQAVVDSNGVWNADTLWVGQFYTSSMMVGAGGSVRAVAELNLGGDGANTQASLESIGRATVGASGGGEIAAGSLNVMDGSLLTVDSLSAVVIGGGPSVAGALAIGSGGAADLESSSVVANIVDNGLLTAQINLGASSVAVGIGPIVSGVLSGTGSLRVGAGYTMEIAEAAGFAGSTTIDAGGTLRLDAGAAPSGSISMRGGTIDLRGLAFGTGQPLAYSGSLLTVGGETLDVGAGLSAAAFSARADAGGGTMVVETPCYAAGTRIAAARGEVLVELLRVGDRVRTAAGRLAPVRWVGQRTLALRGQPGAAPVLIAADAFAPGLPRRALLVSPDHAIAVDGVLMPARLLVNGATIRRACDLAGVTYVHVELDRHDLLLAEGLPAESFLDTGNRGQLDPDAPVPQFEADPAAAALRIFAERGCAPLMLGGPLVAAAQARLGARAAALGWRLVTDPGLALRSDPPGLRVAAEGPDTLRVTLPPGTRQVGLTSRTFVPADLDPARGDARTLGVALAAECDGQPLAGDAFAAGWYGADPGEHWRWTGGAATLRLPVRPRPTVLSLRVMRAGARYWVRTQPAAEAAA